MDPTAIKRFNSYRSKPIEATDKFKPQGRGTAKQESAAKILCGSFCWSWG